MAMTINGTINDTINDTVNEAIGQRGASPVAMLVLMLVLAGLDLVGAVLAKEWNEGRGVGLFLSGAGVFLLLFVVYAFGLRYAEMSTVTFGWIVGLQVAILAVERVRYGVTLPTGKWVAIGAILALQAYLVLAPNGGDQHPRSVPQRASSTTAESTGSRE